MNVLCVCVCVVSVETLCVWWCVCVGSQGDPSVV